MSTAEIELQQQHQYSTVDVPPVAGAPPRVGAEGSSEPAGDAPQAADGDGGSGHSVGTQDLQNVRLVADIGDGRTIDIPLRGNIVLQQQNSSSAPEAAPAGDDNMEYLDKMRGWLMTVATLFIGIAFQAAMQRPNWIPDNWYQVLSMKGASSGAPTMLAPSPSPTAAAAAAITFTRGQAVKAYIYAFCNTVTFAASLTLVVLMLLMNKSPPARAIVTVKFMVSIVCVAVGFTFTVGNSYGTGVMWVSTIVVTYAFIVALNIFATLPYVGRLGATVRRRWRGNQ